jgi:hypothetical protein
MALELNFTITQDDNCDKLTFIETTGAYSSPDNEGGYGTPNPLFSEIGFTQLIVELPDGSTKYVKKGYTPTSGTSPNGTYNIVPDDIDYTGFPNGVYNMEFEAYLNVSTPSGGLVNGTKYAVVGGTITYGSSNYEDTDVFTAGSVDTYTVVSGAPLILPLEATKNCNVLIYCHLRSCLRKLMLERCTSDCDCKETLGDKVSELVIDFNAAVLAFNNQNYKCASDTIARLEKACGGICNDCNC